MPIFVSLPTLREPVTTAVEEALEAKGFSRRNIKELRDSHYRFVILLDAVDELKEKSRRALFFLMMCTSTYKKVSLMMCSTHVRECFS